jgi:conjugative relaxase-like TrwC/TraI family protein
MFTAVAHKSLAGAEGYFVEHFSQNDYYAAGEVRPGQWIGIGAERLGLGAGLEVSREQFCALCENRHPQTDERLTLRQNAKDQRRVFFDFTCSAPKSVSVLAVTLDDQRLVQAHQESARVAFGELEAFAATRVRKHGNQRDRTTGNLVAAAFVHTSSRALDPLLHTHFTVFNGTFDDREQCWKALQAGGMYDAIRYATAVYRNELALRVRGIGYHTVAAKHGFEIEGVGNSIMRRFSKRSQELDNVVRGMEQKLGRKLSNNEAAYAVHRTRPRKLNGISTFEVRQRQLAQLQSTELESLRTLLSSAQGGQVVSGPPREREALAYATAHVFERKSVVPEHELLAAALRHRPGDLDLSRLKQGFRQASELVPTNRGFSTRQILETELFLIQTVDAGRDAMAPLNPTCQPADWLGEDQRRSVLHVLNTGDRITGIRGLAGTGKTTVLREIAAACTGAGIGPLFCAPTAAATDVLRKEGFNAVTLQGLFQSRHLLFDHSVVVLDEAGAVGIDDMKRLFEMAKAARIVLVGDTSQHGSVARGDALRILEQYSSFQSGQLTRIHRQQQAEYRHAVELAAQKRAPEAFAQLERMGAIVELSGSDLHSAAAQAYLKALKSEKSALLVAPTWTEIEAVTERVRSALKEQGLIGAQEHSLQVFDSLSWTEAQKQDAQQYRPGMALQFHGTQRGFSRGESVEVVGVAADTLTVRRSDGSARELKLGRGSASFDAGESRTLNVAAGDKLLLQANAVAARKRFINGELVEVKEVQCGRIMLTDGRVIPQDYRAFTHGYAVTSHAAQGKTVNEVLVVASSRSLPAVHQQQFYVSISRGRERCQVFTDDKELLRAHVTRSGARTAAVEVVPPAAFRQQNNIGRILQWAERVAELARVNGDLPEQQQISTSNQLSQREGINAYGPNPRISVH